MSPKCKQKLHVFTEYENSNGKIHKELLKVISKKTVDLCILIHGLLISTVTYFSTIDMSCL